ncbi:MAG: DUF3413 domain-containing protein [Povalibacter sp.]
MDIGEKQQLRHRLIRWWAGFLLVTMLACATIATRYIDVADLSSSGIVLLFRAAMMIGHFGLLGTLFLAPALLLTFIWPRPRAVLAVGIVCAALMLALLLLDTQVYQLYRFHINAGVMNLLFAGAASETFIFSDRVYLYACAIVAMVVIAAAFVAVLLWRAVARFHWVTLPRNLAALIVVGLLGFHLGHIWADAMGYEPVLEQPAILPLSYPATAKESLRKMGFAVRYGDPLRSAERQDASPLSYPLAPLQCNANTKPPNIVFILVDSWRFDEMNERVTPHVAQFAPRTTRFTDHLSGGNATRIGVFSLFYSIPGTYWHQVLSEQQSPVFIDELQRQHYDVQVFRSAPLYSPEFDRTIFANVKAPRLRSKGAGPTDWDRDLTNDFHRYLQQRGDAQRPFFALLFYDSPHNFQVPAGYPLAFQPSASDVNYIRLNAHTDPAPLRNLYRNSLHYVDELIGEALEDVERRGLLENTIVVITGDHGQEFNDAGKNYWGHNSNFTRYQTGVPMLLYVPGQQGSVVRHRTTHFDVAPTLLHDYLGCTSQFSAFSVGHSLFDPTDREPLLLSEYADFAIVDRGRIALVRDAGMRVLDSEYSPTHEPLDPEVAHAALEQKTRFYRSARWRSQHSKNKYTTIAAK